MSTLCITLLGGLTLTWDEVPVPPLSGVATRSLLAYLVTYYDKSHTCDLLAGTFWLELPGAVARRRIHRDLPPGAERDTRCRREGSGGGE